MLLRTGTVRGPVVAEAPSRKRTICVWSSKAAATVTRALPTRRTRRCWTFRSIHNPIKLRF